MLLDKPKKILEKILEVIAQMEANPQVDDLQKAQLMQAILNAKAALLKELESIKNNLSDQDKPAYEALQQQVDKLDDEIQRLIGQIDFSKVKDSLDTFSHGLTELIKKKQKSTN